ncbi:ADP-ribosylglycohydrolase family protein [Leifsonia sp. PS1209]|uniref:ADP-ribosylglycohydrolase family protein n=1 Tax=Leifsonia sp. PS1209 TaxID=2724914 RepID=UPI001442AE17|nr:ADP-ribosylglycohydrolase family protein [Leifsonia sp. PS1209]QJA00034.1 ADP-ribosylglycohydrolase family protein [Leifsonia sp. PS1209]
MLRLSWTQPEDLLPHALVAAELDGRPVADLRERWEAAGGAPTAAVSGATAEPAPPALVALARELLAEIDERDDPAALLAAEPDALDAILAASPIGDAGEADGGRSDRPDDTGDPADPGALGDLGDRILGAWLGRASGCLLGKPVEKISLEGIRAIARSTGNWPLRSYFTEVGLDPEVAARYPWNRRSRPTSLVENIDGMPEDDDLNFPLIALGLLERSGDAFTTDDVAQAWLDSLPGGRVFTAERVVYRNLLDGYEPEQAAAARNPFRDWIGAQIRTDVYGWAHPGDPVAAARLAWTDARLSHARNGVYGAMFAAAACSAAVVADGVAETRVTRAIEAGLSVVPTGSRYAAAIRRGVELGESDLDDEAAVDALHAEFGHLHWVHVLGNSAVLAFALTRGAGDFERTITLAVSGGWDTDSVGATAGSIAGAVTGARALPARWIDPLHDTLATSVPGFSGVRFSDLAERTLRLAEGGERTERTERTR